MASTKEYLDFILEQLSDLDEISFRAMMGEYIIYYRGKVVGGIYDDRFLPENNAGKLYFEERDIEGFVEKLEKYYPDVKYVNQLMTHSWGQKVIRFYDPDGNLIEVGTPV